MLFILSHLPSLSLGLGGLALLADGFSSSFDDDLDFEEVEAAVFGVLDESDGGFEDDLVGGARDEDDFVAGVFEDDAGVLDVDAGVLDVDAGALDDDNFDVDDDDFDVDDDDFEVDDDDFAPLVEALAPEDDDFEEDEEALGAPGAGLVLEVGSLVPGAGLVEGFGLVLSEPPGFGTLSLSFISVFLTVSSYLLALW